MMKRIIVVMMILVVSVWAEEIGKPYIPKGSGEIDSAILAPDGKTFYTLKGELVTKWQLEPIKKLDSFKTVLNHKDKRYGYQIDITADGKKMFIRSHSEIILWDLKAKNEIKREQQRTDWGVVDGQVYKTIYSYRKTNDQHYIVDEGTIYKEWDLRLNQVKNEVLPALCSNTGYTCYPNFMYINHDEIFAFTPESSHSSSMMSILNKKTLKIIKGLSFDDHWYVTADRKSIYLGQRSPAEFYLKVNIDTLTEEKITLDKFKKTDMLYSQQKAIRKSMSVVGSLNLVFIPNKVTRRFEYVFYNSSNKKVTSFYQFKDSEWAVIDENGYFEVSLYAKKYLKMKTSSSDILPINNITYKKYNKRFKKCQ